MRMRVIARAKFARKITEQGRTAPHDADGDAVLACALAARADWIIAGDAHLPNLKHYQGMRITDAAQVVRVVPQ